MTWKTNIPELIKTLVDGTECECDTKSGRLTTFRFYENLFSYKLGPYWYATGSFGDVIRWRPVRPKVEHIDVRENHNGLWSFYVGNARVYITEKPDLQRIQTLDEDRDYSGARVQYFPYTRIRLEQVGVTGCAWAREYHLEPWIAGNRCVPHDAATTQVKPKVGRINASIYYDHVSLSFLHVRCNWSGAKCPSMAAVAAVYPDLDFSEAFFTINE